LRRKPGFLGLGFFGVFFAQLINSSYVRSRPYELRTIATFITKRSFMSGSENVSFTKGLTIGDAAKMCDVPAYTIRYWEKEFKEYLSPTRTLGKQRRYGERHLNRVLQIKKLLWEDRFSIEGAKRLLAGFHIAPAPLDVKKAGITDPHDLALHIATFIRDYVTTMRMTEANVK
jgi:DNA-binding transcriptional MerR regulator